jgi:hypothetical protein
MFLVNAGRVQAVPTTDVVPIITGLNKPAAITHAGDGSNWLFITYAGTGWSPPKAK